MWIREITLVIPEPRTRRGLCETNGWCCDPSGRKDGCSIGCASVTTVGDAVTVVFGCEEIFQFYSILREREVVASRPLMVFFNYEFVRSLFSSCFFHGP